jgi:AraC family transcriptional regulator
VCAVLRGLLSAQQFEFSHARIPAQRYAVFSHRGQVSTLRATVYTVWTDVRTRDSVSLPVC